MNRNVLFVGAGLLMLLAWSRRASASQAPADAVGRSDSLVSDLIDWGQNMTSDMTRGERNNNPGNLRHGPLWVGLAADQTDSAFAQFSTATMGIRALALNLRTYFHKYGLTTIRAIINRWAPPSENNTSAYVLAVSRDMGIDPDTALNLDDAGTLQSLVAAIIHQENGRVAYGPDVIAAGVQASFA